MTLVHKRRGAGFQVVEHVVRTISRALGLDAGDVHPLLPAATPGPSNFQCFVHGCVENAVHPYCKAFYTDVRRREDRAGCAMSDGTAGPDDLTNSPPSTHPPID